MKRITLTGIAALALLAGNLVQAEPQDRGFHRGGPDKQFAGPGAFGPRLAELLQLDETQMARIEAIRESAKPQRQELADAMEANREALNKASEFDSYDAQLIAELAAEQGALHAQRTELATGLRHQTQAVLTADQRQALAILHEERSERRDRRQDRRAGRRNRDDRG